jgi:hypothetical protein
MKIPHTTFGGGLGKFNYKEKMVPNVGFEPTTYRLQIGCSTVELIRRLEHVKVSRMYTIFPQVQA